MLYCRKQNLIAGGIALKVKIFSDSTGDISDELVAKFGIEVLPLYVIKNDKAYRDGVEITPEDIYAHVAGGGALCTTAAVSVADYLKAFSQALKSYDAVVSLHISSSMSACYQNACIAASELGNVYPVDSRSLSNGIAALAVDGVKMAEGGMSAPDIQKELLKRRDRLNVSFVVDTLEYLKKGGRCSPLMAMGANLLSLKPCIELKDGAMGVGKKYRGTMRKCLMNYISDRLENHTDVDTRRVFIINSGNVPQALLNEVEETILRLQPFREVYHTRAGGTICCHCGPGTLGMMYYNK